MKLLEEYGFLRVSKEEKIRGQMERTYCIGDISISKSDNDEDGMKSVDLFLKKIRSEYDDLCLEIKGVLNKYIAKEKTMERKNRNLYIISKPGKESL